jgi:hypothetical protein
MESMAHWTRRSDLATYTQAHDSINDSYKVTYHRAKHGESEVSFAAFLNLEFSSSSDTRFLLKSFLRCLHGSVKALSISDSRPFSL